MLASNWLTCYGGYCLEPMLGSLCTWCYKVPREQEVKNEPQYMNCNANSLGIASVEKSRTFAESLRGLAQDARKARIICRSAWNLILYFDLSIFTSCSG